MNRNIQSAYAKKVLGVLLAVLVSASSISVVVFDATEVSVNANPETTVGGIFWENTTWTLDNSPYIVTDTVQIPENVVLTIEPGVVVESALNSSEDFMFVLHGKIIARGTADNKIVFDGGCVATGFSQDSSSYGSSFFTTSGALSDSQLILDHCVIKNGNRFYWGTRGHLNLTNSELTNLGLTFWGYNGRSQIYYPGQDVYIQNNLFINITGFEIANLNADVFIRYNLFTENRGPLVWNTQGGESRTFINYNSFIDVSGTVLRLSTSGADVILDATNNYWGKTNTSTIDSLILDGNDDISIRGVIEYSPILTAPHPDTPTLYTYTEVSGIIESKTTWTLENSPYLVTEDVLVDSGVILAIEAGVTVEFTNDTNLIIDGGLTAQGNSTHPITFTSHTATPAPGDWGAIKFRYKSNDDAAVIDWAIISYATDAITAESSSPTIQNSRIEYNIVGVRIRQTWEDDFPEVLVQNCIISDNIGREIDSRIGREGGISIDLDIFNPWFPASSMGWVYVKDSFIENNNGCGITSDDYSTQTFISALGSVIQNNSGHGICGREITVENSLVRNNGGDGIRGSSSSAIRVSDSNITNNGGNGVGGIYAEPSVELVRTIVSNNAGAGVHVAVINVTNSEITGNQQSGILSSEGSIHSSNIFDNIPFDFENIDMYDVDVTNNWWGTTNDTLISQKIYDFYDDYDLGKVTFVPFLTEPNPETTPIPEFQSWVLLSLLITATLLVIPCKRSLSSKKVTANFGDRTS